MLLKKRILAAGLALGGIAACNTPSVPLPPPDLPALSFQPPTVPTPGFVVLDGKPSQRHIDARFSVLNRSNGEGVIVTAGHDGAFTTAPFAGVDGDTIQMYYDTFEGEHSTELCVELRTGVMLISTSCP